ncbi:histidine kinase [Thermopolyspora sp. NPDC052614]|uniref:sensor histidine kinase n=1 Tax=Thermopolyspora sp. NPDC052614 TaxID=3155682 RepID=UPI00343EAEFD
MRVTSGGPLNRLRDNPVLGDSMLALLLALASMIIAAIVDPALDPVLGLAGGPARGPGTGEDSVLGMVLIVSACAPVALQRRRPYAMLVLSQAPIIALAAIGADAGSADLATLVLLHSVAAHRGLAVSLIAVATVGIGYVITVALHDGVWATHLLAAALIFAAWMTGRSARLRWAYMSELEDRAARLERAREADRRAARVEERSRIARELHDVVAHHVSVMTVQAAAARKVLAANPKLAADALSAIEELGRTAMAEMRSIVGVLRTDGEEAGERAPQPGVGDLPGLVEQMREAGLRTQLWIEGERFRLPPGVDLAAYRLVQEALTNSLRHAGPSARAWVTVSHEPGELTVRVEDDGRGVAKGRHGSSGTGDSSGAPGGAGGPAGSAGRATGDRSGHGLVGIRERVALYGGVLRIGPRQGGGFEVCARFPIKTVPPGEI